MNKKLSDYTLEQQKNTMDYWYEKLKLAIYSPATPGGKDAKSQLDNMNFPVAENKKDE